MCKKMMCLILACVMLVSVSPVVAADNASAKPTIEEILNEYHQKTFDAQTPDETGNARAYSLHSEGKSLEEETVDALTEAGYEAYHVTEENYADLENNLKTDFEEMGLDPSCSYIVAISGEDPEASANPNSRLGNLPVQDWIDDGGVIGNPYFEYEYEGFTLRMRYLTITAATSGNPIVESEYHLAHNYWFENAVMDVLDSTIVAIVDGAIEKIPVGTAASLVYGWTEDPNYTELEPGTLSIRAVSTWTAHSIQVWNEASQCWDVTQCSESVYSIAYTHGFMWNPVTGLPESYQSDSFAKTFYSLKYHNTALRKQEAAEAFCNLHNQASLDFVYRIDFYFEKENGEILYIENGKPVFTHGRSYGFAVRFLE